ncbi:hypothetical protein [Streptomyces sp. NPDC048636]|uniref:hypothetical protein n=1 Tax=Streptomyces sp. NPDC048636 TaxID=3155762 RepID=UPI0034244CA5
MTNGVFLCFAALADGFTATSALTGEHGEPRSEPRSFLGPEDVRDREYVEEGREEKRQWNVGRKPVEDRQKMRKIRETPTDGRRTGQDAATQVKLPIANAPRSMIGFSGARYRPDASRFGHEARLTGRSYAPFLHTVPDGGHGKYFRENEDTLPLAPHRSIGYQAKNNL